MISAVVLTKNEESTIKNCLQSLSFCKEIIIVDDFSNDKTIKIAREFTAKIFTRRLSDDFSKQRNFGLQQASYDWVFFIDADEIVNHKLKNEIIKASKNNSYEGYLIKREDMFLGHRMHHGELSNMKLLRLARKESGRWERPIHEVWKVDGKIGILNNPLLHSSHQNIKEFLLKINDYSTINAKYLSSINSDASIRDIVLFPSTKFFLNFILKHGFLDGIYGFIHAVLMSLHSFLTRSKLYLIKYAKQ